MTTTELRRKVLEKLQAVAAGEPVDASDGQVVQKAYEELHEILLQDNLIEWTVTEDIPSAYGAVMIPMLAAQLVDEFHCPPDLRVSIIGEGKYDLAPPLGPSVAERRLRKLAAPGFNGEPAQPDYY